MPNSSLGIRPILASTQTLLWPLYLVWSAVVLAVWCLGIGEVELQNAVTHPDLGAALQVFLRFLDPLWIALGFYHVYSTLVIEEGLARARRWIGSGFVICILIAWLSARTSWPLGPIHFTERLGKKLGPVPLCLPLLWLTVILGARATAVRLLAGPFPRAIPALCAALTCASALVLDPVAWKQRSWWLWYPADVNAPPAAPWTAPLTLFVASLAAGALMGGKRRASPGTRTTSVPLVVFVVVNAVALTARIVSALR